MHQLMNENRETSRTVIISDKQLGDVTLLEPLTRLLSKRDGAPVAMHVKDAFRPLIELMPHARWSQTKAKQRFTESLTVNWGSRAAKQTFMVPAKHKKLIINRTSQKRWWFRFVYDDIMLHPIKHEYWGHYFWRVVGGSHEVDFTGPKLTDPPDDWRHPETPNKPFFVINPTSAWENKSWTVKAWQEFIQKAECDPSVPWVMAGGSSKLERVHCDAISEQNARPLLDLSGKTTLKQYLHLLSRAKTVVSVDGAASHLAQAFDRPVLTLFGPTDERKWHLPTPRHHALCVRHFSSTSEFPPMSELRVSDVLASFHRLLSE